MAGKDLVPYQPRPYDDDPRPQPPVRDTSRQARFLDALEALFLDRNKAELLGLGGDLFGALWGAFVAVALLLLVYTGQVGIIRPGAWVNHPEGPLMGLWGGLLWLVGVTLQKWQWVFWVWLPIAVWRTFHRARRALPRALLHRREDREAAERAYQQSVREWEHRQAMKRAAIEQERQARITEARQAEEERCQRIIAHQRDREALRLRIEHSINAEIGRERLARMFDDEDPDAPYQRVRAALQKTPLTPDWGLLRNTRDAGVRRVIGTGDWLPPEPPYPPGLDPALLN